MWRKVVPILLLALQISTTGIALNNTAKGSTLLQKQIPFGSEINNNSHRIIKRFTRFKFPKPQLPTLPRPTFPFPVFNTGFPKGDDGKVPKSRKRQRQRTKKPTEPSTSPRPSKTQEDRTLLAAKKAIFLKKAILAKKAIILAKLKKKAFKKKKKFKKKAVLLYGLNKVSKMKGFTIKAPNIQVSVGKKGIKKAAATTSEEEAEFLNSQEGTENYSGDSETDEDDDDDDELDGDDYDNPKPQNKPNTNDGFSEEQQQQQPQRVPMVQQQQAPMVQQLQQQPPTVQQVQTTSMMQQLQQQLQQKQQQEQLMQQQKLQQEQLNQQQQQQQAQLLHAQQQQQAIIITPTDTVETTEGYTSSKKAAKKAKKKKGKITPRPVDLGVKANLIKKFDKLTKKAQHQLSSFIQIDIDFFRSGETGRSASDDLIEPGRFISRSARIPPNSYELTEDYDYVSDVEVPGNFVPSWDVPVWKSEYPSREEISREKANCSVPGLSSCKLTPVYVVFKHDERGADVVK